MRDRAKYTYSLCRVCLVFFLFHLLLPCTTAATEICYLEPPSGYQNMGGSGRLGPYEYRSRCEAINSEYFQGQGTCYCSYTSTPSSSPDKQPQPGIDWQEIQRRHEEERRRQEEERRRRLLQEAEDVYQKAAEEARTRFEIDKSETLQSLKGTASKGLGLKTGVPVSDREQSGGTLRLKGLESSDPIGKEPFFTRGYKGSAPPKFEDINPKWPLVIDPAKVQGGTSVALQTANRRTHLLLDALEAGQGSWEISIQYLQDRLRKNPNDIDLRDALNFLQGLYNGQLGAREVGDNYYKYGVRQWLAGDYNGAARAFAQAARENPDDLMAYNTFAQTMGLRDGYSDCKAAAQCDTLIHPPARILFDADEQAMLRELRKQTANTPQNLELRAAYNILEGYAAYMDYVDARTTEKILPFNDETEHKVSEGLNHMNTGKYREAMIAFAEAYAYQSQTGGIGDRGLLFVINYADGLARAQAGKDAIYKYDPRYQDVLATYHREIWEVFPQSELKEFTRLAEERNSIRNAFSDDELELFNRLAGKRNSIKRLKEEIGDVMSRNPFFGILPAEALKRLQSGRLFVSE